MTEKEKKDLELWETIYHYEAVAHKNKRTNLSMKEPTDAAGS